MSPPPPRPPVWPTTAVTAALVPAASFARRRQRGPARASAGPSLTIALAPGLAASIVLCLGLGGLEAHRIGTWSDAAVIGWLATAAAISAACWALRPRGRAAAEHAGGRRALGRSLRKARKQFRRGEGRPALMMFDVAPRRSWAARDGGELAERERTFMAAVRVALVDAPTCLYRLRRGRFALVLREEPPSESGSAKNERPHPELVAARVLLELRIAASRGDALATVPPAVAWGYASAAESPRWWRRSIEDGLAVAHQRGTVVELRCG